MYVVDVTEHNEKWNLGDLSFAKVFAQSFPELWIHLTACQRDIMVAVFCP